MRSALQFAESIRFDLIIANDIETVPFALRLATTRGARVLVDAHEYAPSQKLRVKDRLLFNPFWYAICRRDLPSADAMVTVCDGISQKYHREFGVSPGVMTNAPFYEDLQPSETDGCRIRLIHHGIASADRRPELMLALMDQLDERFTLDLMLIPTDHVCFSRLVRPARGNRKITFRDPVETGEIARQINPYDMGLFMLPTRTINHELALPNKLFEFIQGRLGVAIWPSQEMARVVSKYECGVISDAFTVEAMARALNGLTTEDVRHVKAKSHLAASELCAERNREVFIETVRRVVGT